MKRWTTGVGVLVVAAVMAACGGGGGGGSTPTTSLGGTTPTTDALPELTATMSAPAALPDGFAATAIARSGDVQVVLGAPTAGGPVQAASRTGDGPWQVVTVGDGAGYAPPAAASDNRNGFTPAGIVAGPNGFVAIGTAAFYTGNYALGSGALVWQSPDGISWTRIDARGAIANIAPSGFMFRQVNSTSSGYLVAGDTGSHTFVLRSSDGITWTQTLDLAKAWALIPRTVAVDGETALLWVDEFDCQADAFASLTQPVLELSSDGGATWTEVQAAAIPTIENVVPEPDAATCGPVDYTSIGQRFVASLGQLGLAGGKLLVTDAAGDKVAVSSDHTTWVESALPPPNPVDDAAYFLESQQPSAVFAVGDRVVMLSGSGPTTKDQPRQLVGWVSEDGGATWASIVATDLLVPPGRFTLVPRSDGSALDLLFQPTDSQGNNPTGVASVATITLG